MKALHVIPYMHPRAGGPVAVVDRLCRRLAVAGWDTSVITTDCYARHEPVETWGADSRPYGLRVHRSRWTPFAPARARSRALSADLERTVPTCDLVHIHTLWTHATAVAIRVARRHGVPFLVMPHGMLDPNSLSRKATKKRIYGRLAEFPRLRGAAGIVYTTPVEQRLAESAVPALPPGHIVALGSDDPSEASREEAAQAFLKEHKYLRGRRLVTHLGRIHPKKGLDLLVPAFARVARRVPDVHLLLVGPDDTDYLRVVNHLAAVCGVDDRVTHIPMLVGERKWQALAASTLFALPSYQENFGIAVAEAARMGLPLVISNRVNLWPDVQAAGAGVVVDCDAEHVATALMTVLSDDTFRRRAGAAAKKLATTRYTWDRSAEALIGVYERVLRTVRFTPATDQPFPNRDRKGAAEPPKAATTN